jgi:DNA-binding CsgD family transcriptional regulator
MAGPRFYDNPTIYPLFALIDELRQGLILLPRFQRPFVWEDEKRLALLDSVRRGMPIGSMLVWRTDKHRLTTPTDLRGWAVGAARQNGPWTYLIDGHQRLMTLLTALTAPAQGHSTDPPGDDRLRWPVYYNLRDEEFTFARRGNTKVPPFWMPLHALISNKTTFEFSKPLYVDGLTVEGDRAEALRNRFSEYWIPVIPMVTDDFMSVTLGFQRINSENTPMSEVHMLHAVCAALDVDLLEELNKARAKHLAPLGDDWSDIDDEDIITTVKLALGVGVDEKDPELLAHRIAKNIMYIDRAAEQLARVIRLLSDACGVKGLKQYLPYRYQVVLLTMAFGPKAKASAMTKTKRDRIVHWFWRSSFLDIFAGISEGRLNQVTNHLRRMLAGDEKVPREKWFEGSVEGPPNPTRDSARLRALRALLAQEGMAPGAIKHLIDNWRVHPYRVPEHVVNLERAMAIEVGLKYTRATLRATAPAKHPAALSQLTAREQEVARMLVDGGLLYREIAVALGVSEGTIRTHIEQIYQRLGVRSRVELTALLR